MAMTVRDVVIQIAPPSRQSPYGLCAIGRYRVEDNILIMLDDDDRPLRDKKGVVRRTLEPGEDAATVARKLTRDITCASLIEMSSAAARSITAPRGGVSLVPPGTNRHLIWPKSALSGYVKNIWKKYPPKCLILLTRH
jgi:hypothetical protein